MHKKRINKKISEHLTLIPAVPEGGNLWDRLNIFFQRREKIIERRQQWRDLDVFHADYLEAGNPLSAWDAYILARKDEKEIPEWVLKYFDDVAERMLRASNSTKDLPHCLGFQTGGGPGEFKQYLTYQMKRTAVAYVKKLVNEEPEMTIEAACEKVSEYINQRWPGAGKKRGKNDDKMLDYFTILKWYRDG